MQFRKNCLAVTATREFEGEPALQIWHNVGCQRVWWFSVFAVP
jgi:hypothetical protein